mgnify:CR=1 FL=1|tara:strand:+ start:687 stop:2309 length:1623 start_codon:yes stop_codon:yes gene_type:complete
MANLTTSLQIKTSSETFGMEMNDQYDQVYRSSEVVDNTDAFITLASLGSTLVGIGASAGQRLKGAKLIVIKNNSSVGAEIQLRYAEWKDDSNIDQTNSVDLGPGSATTSRQLNLLLGANEYIVLPNQWAVGYAEDASGGLAKTIDNKGGYDANGGRMWGDSGANLGAKVEDSETQVTVDDTDFFRVGDLIQLGTTTGTTASNIEIMRVTSIDSATVMQVERQLFGSILADGDTQTSSTNGAVSGANVYLPWFNTQGKYNEDHDDASASGKIFTNESGRFTSQNLFGYGRSATYPTGIVKSSFAMKFYSSGYQELGVSGVTGNSNSGLTASTAYQFNITADGGSAYSLSFTTDASDLSVRKVLNLIQAQLDSAYYASSGNLKGKRVTVGLVNGDIRFTSLNRTRVSAIALADSSGGDTDLWGVGIIPAVANVETAVAAKLPEDVIYSNSDYITKPNTDVFTYDDGKGNLIGGEGSGTINYETGALNIMGPPNAEFVVSFNYDSAHSGGANETANQQNTIKEISARSCNSKLNAEVEILGFV